MISIALFFLILGSILNHNKINQDDNFASMSISIPKLFNILANNNSYANIHHINFTDGKFFLKINTFNQEGFYYLLDMLENDFPAGFRGVHKANKFFIIGK